jgi:chitosanase
MQHKAVLSQNEVAQILQAARSEAQQQGWAVAIAVVDDGGHPLALERLDGCAPIGAYIATRHAWLAGHRRSDLRATAYRMEAFQRLAEQAYWGLELPLVVRGAELSPATLYATPPGCYDGPQPGTRAIALQTPLARGLDVRLLQLALSERGIAIKADGIFGRTSANLLRDYQLSAGLPATGVADPALIGQLVT